MMIAAYSILDGVGARLSGHSTSFLLWFSLFQSVIYVLIVIAMKGKGECVNYGRAYWKRGLFGGVISMFSYAIILWVVTKAPIANVAALREASVLFATIIAVVFLGESLKVSRVISAIMIVSGIAIIKLG